MPAYYLHSGILFRTARTAYERTSGPRSELDGGQNHALVAIVFAAAALEAWIAEIALVLDELSAVSGRPEQVAILHNTLKELEQARASVHAKYRVTKRILSERPYDKGGNPYQDFALLFRVRNALVHMEPEQTLPPLHDERRRTEQLAETLHSKGLCRADEPGMISSWLARISTKAVARWACNVAADMVESIVEHFPLKRELRGGDAVVNMLRRSFHRVQDSESEPQP